MGIRFARAALFAWFAAVGCFGQGTTSRVVGTVTDSTGSAVPSATVTLTNDGTGAKLTNSTTDTGTYVFEAVQSGNYSVSIEAAGFRKFLTRGNPVTIGLPTTVNAVLEVGAVSESVEVAAVAESVQTSTSGNIGNLFPEQVIRDLPIVGTRGRNPLDLVLLQPGVVSGSNTGGGIHVNGARDRSWNYTLDGIDNNETSSGGSNTAPVRTNPDGLAEFRVITSNATADFGRSSGGQVVMITKSGTNEFHGKGFWFYRTPRLNANEWENNINARGQRQFVQHIYGGDFGGPIWKNKTFFYGNLQFLRARESSVTNRTVLTATARQGILRYAIGGRNNPVGVPGASVDASGNVAAGVNVGTYNIASNDPQRLGLDKRITSLVGATPLPNNFNGGDGLNTAFYTFSALQQERQHDASTKFDHVFSAKNAVFARISWGEQDTNCDRVNGGSELFPGRGCIVNTLRSPNNLAFNHRWNPTPAITNEAVLGRNKFTYNFIQPFGNLAEYALSTPVDLVESTEFGNLRTLRTWQFVDNVAWQKKDHAIRFGINLRWQQHLDNRGSIAGLNSSPLLDFSSGVNTVDPRTFGLPTDINVSNDLVTFQSLTNLLLGRVGNRQQGFVADGNAFKPGLYDFAANYGEHDVYVQDTWKARRNLTIDLGLRLEMKPSPTSPQGIVAPDRIVAAGAAGSSGVKWVETDLFKSRYNNFGPSVGFAWDPSGTGKTSVRSNYRIAYDRLPTFTASSSIFPSIPGKVIGVVEKDYGQNGGRLSGVPAVSAPSVQPSSLTQPAAYSANSNTVFDPNLKFPTTHMWSFNIQHEIAPRTVVEVSYIGRRAYHLLGGYNVNQPDIFGTGFVNEFNIVKGGGESNLINRLTSADSRIRAGETGSQAYRRLFPADFTNNAVGTLANRIATQQQGGRLVTDLSGGGTLIPFPQYSGGFNVVDSNDYSTYHGLQTQVERRLYKGFTAQLSYVFSKSLDTRSFDPVFTVASTGTSQTATGTPFDINNRKLNYARSDFDRRHVVQSNFLYELPFGKNSSGLTKRLIGGWQAAGIIRWTSGRPFSVSSGYNTFNNAVASTANCIDCSRDIGQVRDENGLVWYFSPEERAKFSNPAPGQLGNTGRNYFNGPSSFNMDATFLKRTALTERINFELRADATNLTNTPTFGFPTTVLSSSTFGRIRDTISSSSRKVQIGAKFTF